VAAPPQPGRSVGTGSSSEEGLLARGGIRVRPVGAHAAAAAAAPGRSACPARQPRARHPNRPRRARRRTCRPGRADRPCLAGVSVEGANLRVHITALRNALGGVSGNHFVLNVPGLGYSFVAPFEHWGASPLSCSPSCPTRPPPSPGALPPARGKVEFRGKAPHLRCRASVISSISSSGVDQR
jgi:hypothetical protein